MQTAPNPSPVAAPGEPAHVAVVTHSGDDFASGQYVLSRLMDEWEEAGMQVSVVDDPAASLSADVTIVHVDLTVVPGAYRALAERGRAVINGGAVDISKRRVSRQLVRRGTSWDGPVIVKTDRNYGGVPERERGGAAPGLRGLRRMLRKLPWTLTGDLDPACYPIFSSRAQVPLPVWFNRRLVVEAFLPERQGEYYCLRNWIFFGDREISLRSVGTSPVLKAADVVDREFGVEIPDELRRLREELGFDYGKFDFAVSEGRVVLYDANRTPTFSTGRVSTGRGETRSRIADLARGILSWLPS